MLEASTGFATRGRTVAGALSSRGAQPRGMANRYAAELPFPSLCSAATSAATSSKHLLDQGGPAHREVLKAASSTSRRDPRPAGRHSGQRPAVGHRACRKSCPRARRVLVTVEEDRSPARGDRTPHRTPTTLRCPTAPWSYAHGYTERDTDSTWLEPVSRDRGPSGAGWTTCPHRLRPLRAAATDRGRDDDDRRCTRPAGRGDLLRHRPPSTAANPARRVHAPELVLAYESHDRRQAGVPAA
jgi:hypothetical protein